jgi:hypothetical protein
MTVHKFDFETIHLQVLNLALDMLLVTQQLPELEPKLTADHKAAAEHLSAVFKIAMTIDQLDICAVTVPNRKYDNIMDFIKNYKAQKK